MSTLEQIVEVFFHDNDARSTLSSPRTVMMITYLIVSPSVEADKCVGPEAVHSHGAEQNVGVVGLVIVANPSSNESPEGLDSGISPESGGLLWLATCNNMDRMRLSYSV
jgi:hypothetical protein